LLFLSLCITASLLCLSICSICHPVHLLFTLCPPTISLLSYNPSLSYPSFLPLLLNFSLLFSVFLFLSLLSVLSALLFIF
jgi:hypothetical protein